MSKFRFWGTLAVAALFGLIGYIIGSLIKLPPPFTPLQPREFYALAGVMVGLLTFGRIAAWVVRTVTRIAKNITTKLAFEIINQFTSLASRGWPFSLVPAQAPGDPDRELLSGAIILDTSSIIDGRVLEVAKSGFLSGVILVPNFVLTEVQQVADSADDLKRNRGRRGFDIINDLKKVRGLHLEVWDKELTGKTVDDKLVRLGKILHGRILTCDFNLNRVASLSGVAVLNLNELANSLKTLPVPGEKMKIKLIQQGKDKNQGVGYLPDGTMVVVKDASALLGQEIEVEVTRLLQGPAGRMIFGKTITYPHP